MRGCQELGRRSSNGFFWHRRPAAFFPPLFSPGPPASFPHTRLWLLENFPASAEKREGTGDGDPFPPSTCAPSRLALEVLGVPGNGISLPLR